WRTVVNGGEGGVERLELTVVKSSYYGSEGGVNGGEDRLRAGERTKG
ncbi:hypothetical protein Tco_0560198, partial [Tanacetum coccineum]